MHPARIGPFLIDRRIGAGGMGNVYLARHNETGEVVAVKELPATLARDEGFVHRFNREIEAMRKLNNSHIVKLFDSGVDDGTYYYSMEYVDGDTLTSRLRRERRIPWQEAVEIARQICVGLKHAHDAGVVHRDLKPSNLIFTKQGVVKIADFGVAQVFAADRLTLTGGVIGTAEFMSPEQVTGTRTDKRSDLYSLGAILYTMLVGQPPFLGETASDIMQKQRFGRFDPPKNYLSDLPSWLNDLVCQLLEKEPAKRPPDAFVTAKRLQEVVKKVELRESESEVSSSSVTRAESANPPQAVGATFVRDLFRAEVSEEPVTLFEKAFNNFWVLISLLLLILIGASWLWWHTSGPGDAEDNFSAKSEAERIVQRARWRWKGGDPQSAMMQLEALRSVIQGDPQQEQIVKSIDRLRRAIGDQTETPDQFGFVERALKRADGLASENPNEARQICEGIIKLYQSDRRLKMFVEQARTKLQTLND